MMKRTAVLVGIVALGLMVSGCSKCGFWWDELQPAPHSCKGDFPK